MSTELVITNAVVVCPDGVIRGGLRLRNGMIDEVLPDACRGDADFGGDLLTPGAIDVHTDNLERHMSPRPQVFWPAHAAVVAHDAEISAAGVTTVLDSICIGMDGWAHRGSEETRRAIDALDSAARHGRLKADHLLHLRAEVPAPDAANEFSTYAEHPNLRLVSLMDHTPGQRQYRDLTVFRESRKKQRLTEQEIEATVIKRREQQAKYACANRRAVVQLAKQRGVPVASHDDETLEHVEQAKAEGLDLCEFPTTMEAAESARKHGMRTIAGSPNLVLGGSHSGNVAVADLAHSGLLDILSSDYVPASLFHGAYLLHTLVGFPLHQALATITSHPAQAVGITDRGSIEPGKRADLVRLRCSDGLPRVVEVWKNGARVA